MRASVALAALCAIALCLPVEAARKTPSTRASTLTTSTGAQTTTVSIPSGSTWAVIAFSFTNINGAPTSVSLDGQTATKVVSNEAGGSVEIAVYKVAGFSTGASKTLAWTNPAGIQTVNAAIEYRDGTPTYGVSDEDFGGSGTLSSISLTNSNGDEIISAYAASSFDMSSFGSGQTQLDGTTGSLFYGFTTETGTGVSDIQSFTSSGNKTYAVVVVGSASPPTYSVSPAIGTRTTSTIPITQTTTCSDCTAYFVAETSGLGTPTCTQIKAGQGADGNAAYKSASGAITASVQLTLTLSSYTDGTVRDGYGCLNSTGSGDSAVASILSMYKIPAFTTALTVSSTSATAYTSNAKVLDGAGTVVWVRCPVGSSAPSVAQVEAAAGGCITDSSSGTATGAQTLTLATSPQAPLSDLYFVGTYGSQHEAAVHSLTSQCLSAPTGFQFVNCPTGLTSVTAVGSVPKAFNDAAFKTVAYKTQTANFTVGSVLVDSTSNAWGFILLDSDSGATGTLTILKSSGTFANNDVLFDQGGGAAVVNGAEGAYPTIAIGDVLSVPSTVSPSGAALAVDTTGQYGYTASGRQTALAGLIYDVSAQAYMSLTLDFYSNNATPAASGPQAPFFSHGTTISYNVASFFADADTETLKYGRITAIPHNTAFNPTTGLLTGTVDTDATTVMTFVGFDAALTYGSQAVTMTVATSWPMPNCLVLTASVCVNQIQATTLGNVSASITYQCNVAAFDTVLSQSPAAGTTLFPGNSASVVASAGNTCVLVPSCLSQTVSQCTTTVIATAPGATVSAGTGCTAPSKKIYTQGPAIGDFAPTNYSLLVYCR